MGLPKNRANNRQKRKEGRDHDHTPLLSLVQEQESHRARRTSPIVIKPLNDAQNTYDRAMHSRLITFGIGPAGTGKTWLAAARAAEALRDGEIAKIIVTRPAVTAEEELGFLPGELDEKYEPYFRPVRDALVEVLGIGPFSYHLRAGNIEARPLGLLRGATLKDCWVIADEMQNATRSQMKMLLTRFGENATFIINGDPRQCDLPRKSDSGLMDAVKRLRSNAKIGVVEFGVEDIVRHGIVQEIIEAYEADPANDDAPDDLGVRKTIGV